MAATESSFESAIETIKSDSNVSKVSVIKDIGDFEKVVTIRGEEFTLKIQIPRSTSEDLTPSISLQSSRLSGDTLESTSGKLQDFARAHKTDHDLILSLFSLTKGDISDTPISSDACGSNQKAKKALPKKKMKQKQRNTNAKTDAKSSKKPSMKTAEDVVKRVLWDESISQEDITIGYIDRFTGLQEKPFLAFSWEDLASIDYFTFAIPKHRIQYFKYKKEVIWDKSLRMDNVFGSAGSNRTILEVIAEYRDEDHASEPVVTTLPQIHSNPAPTAAESAAALAHLNISDNVDAYGGSDSDDNLFADDSSDDDGIVVTVDNDKSSEIYSQSEDENDEDGDRTTDGRAYGPTGYWMDKIRPNFFLCVRVTNPEIVDAVARVQETVKEREPRYASCCVAPCMLHVTLCTLRLNNAEEASHCLEVLRKFSSEIRALLPKAPLHLSGLDRFFHRVLYSHARHGADFLTFVEHVCTILRSEGIRLMDHHDFVPHMTVMKVSRPVSRLMNTKYIAPQVFSGLEDTEFGSQPIDSIYLCSMEKERGPDGFYLSPGCLTFSREVLKN